LRANPTLFGRPLLCGAALLSLFLASPAGAQIQVDVNRRPVNFGNVGPARIGGRVFIPLRAVVEALGAEVRWEAATQTVHGSKGTREFALPIGSRTAQVNGRTMDLDAPARLISGNTMVPLRFVAEALGAEVEWNAPQQTVAISLADEGGGRDVDPASISGELVSVQADARPPTITVRTAGVRQTYRLSEDTRVQRGRAGGRLERVEADQLRPGDQVIVRLDAAGRVAEQVDATASRTTERDDDRTGGEGDRLVRGEVVRMLLRNTPPLMVVMVDGARKTYEVTNARVFVRAARGEERVAGTLRDVKPGDRVMLRLDRTGQIAERIDATKASTR
jgi:hypothetical protein